MPQIAQILSPFAGAAFLTVIGWFAWRTWKYYRERDGAGFPRCQSCGYDLRGSPNRCPECGTIAFDRRQYLRSLRNDWPDSPINPREPSLGEPPVLLVSTGSPMESQWLEQQLRARGVACFVKPAGQAMALSDAEMFYRVYVYAADEEIAREYLWRAQGLPVELHDELRSRSRAAAVPAT